jgi:hypothetical protein
MAGIRDLGVDLGRRGSQFQHVAQHRDAAAPALRLGRRQHVEPGGERGGVGVEGVVDEFDRQVAGARQVERLARAPARNRLPAGRARCAASATSAPTTSQADRAISAFIA